MNRASIAKLWDEIEPRPKWGFIVMPLGYAGPPVGNYLYRLMHNFEVSVTTRIQDKGPEITYSMEIPAGFVTDFASVRPRRLWRYMPPVSGRHARAALAHNYLFVEQRCFKDGVMTALQQLEADWIFRHIMLEDEVTTLLAKAAYSFVRAFARGEWEN